MTDVGHKWWKALSYKEVLRLSKQALQTANQDVIFDLLEELEKVKRTTGKACVKVIFSKMKELKLAHAESHDLNCLLTTFKEFGDMFPRFYKDEAKGLERIRMTLELYVQLVRSTGWPTFHANGDKELLRMQQTFMKCNSRRLRIFHRTRPRLRCGV